MRSISKSTKLTMISILRVFLQGNKKRQPTPANRTDAGMLSVSKEASAYTQAGDGSIIALVITSAEWGSHYRTQRCGRKNIRGVENPPKKISTTYRRGKKVKLYIKFSKPVLFVVTGLLQVLTFPSLLFFHSTIVKISVTNTILPEDTALFLLFYHRGENPPVAIWHIQLSDSILCLGNQDISFLSRFSG